MKTEANVANEMGSGIKTRTRRNLAPFPHMASLNLFREPDGSYEITGGGADFDVLMETPDGLKPIDHVENMIVAAAERMKLRMQAFGTYRNYAA